MVAYYAENSPSENNMAVEFVSKRSDGLAGLRSSDLGMFLGLWQLGIFLQWHTHAGVIVN